MLGFVFAIGKEMYDGITGKGVVEFYDVVATMIGSFVAIGMLIVISWII